MSISEAWALGLVALTHDTAENSFNIDQVSGFRPAPGIQKMLLGSDGETDPTFLAVPGTDPRFLFDSSMLGTLLGKNSSAFLISGLAIDSSGSGYTSLDGYLKKYAQGGTIASGSVHKRLRISAGMLVPRQISAQQGAPATITCEAAPRSTDGSTAPVATSDVAAPAASTVSEVYTLGPVKYNGTALEGIQSLTIDPGLSIMALGSDGETYNTFIAIPSRSPTISIMTTKASCIDTFGWLGQAITTGVVAYLRKMAQGGTLEADDSTLNISITGGAGMSFWEELPVRHGGQAMARVTTVLRKGTPDILVIDTTADIT